MLGRNRSSDNNIYGQSVFRMWNYFPWLPTALTEIIRFLSGFQLFSIFASHSQLFIWRKTDSNIYNVFVLSLDSPVTTYASAWYINSPVFDGGNRNQLKSIDEINVSYMCDSSNPFFPHWGTIKMYMRLSPWDSFTQIGSSYTKTDIGNIKITGKEIADANLDSFYQAEFRCLIEPGSTTLSPLVTGIEVLYQTLND